MTDHPPFAHDTVNPPAGSAPSNADQAVQARNGDIGDLALSRRALFGGVGGVAAVATLVACSSLDSGGGQADNDSYQPQFFQPGEWAFLRAAVDRLIPADALGGGALAAGVPGFIDRQMLTPYGEGAHIYRSGPFVPDAPKQFGYQGELTPRQVYRQGIADATAHAQQAMGKGFVDLDADRQTRLLQMWEKGEGQFPNVPVTLFFTQLLHNTKEGFFCDPIHGGNRNMIGWTLIGFPGARADFIDWVERNEAYPLPPVSINGSRPRA